jgi:putative ABC transport system ATP-binding protein
MMATIRRPSLLLLDEHTAALDPRAPSRLLMVTRDVVREYQLTTLHGDRTRWSRRSSWVTGRS